MGAFLLVWLIGDFGYSRYIAYQIQQWESQVQRDEQGVREGCQAFTLGESPSAILLVHGFNETPQIWRKMAPELAKRNFTSRALRLPGFGETIDNYGKVSVDQWREQLAREIQQLQQTHSMIVIVAHSLGGALTLNHLLQHPGSVDGIVLLAPAIQTANIRSPFLTARFWHEFAKWTLPFSRVAMSPFEYDAKDPVERAVTLRNKFSPRQVVSNLYLLIDENLDRAGEIQTPALFIISPDDQVIDVESVRNYYEALGSNRKQFIEAKQSGHALPVDLDWPMITDKIETFANELVTDPVGF